MADFKVELLAELIMSGAYDQIKQLESQPVHLQVELDGLKEQTAEFRKLTKELKDYQKISKQQQSLPVGFDQKQINQITAAFGRLEASINNIQKAFGTLDDSANRRISMPEGFLCADAILRLAQNVTDGLHVNEKIVERTVNEYLPFIATENLMMEAVKRGGDRQEIHEIIRKCSMEATAQMKNGGVCDLLARLVAEETFVLTEEEMQSILKPEKYIGRCAEQVEQYVAKVRPLIADISRETAEINL